MNAQLDQIKQLAAKGEEGRLQLMAALHSMAYALETPDDTISRYGAMNLQAATVQVGINSGLFRHLGTSESPLSVDELSEKTRAEAQLMTRILRYLATTGAVDEVGRGLYSANHVTKNLTEKVTEAGLSHYFYTVATQYQALPSFLSKTGYKDPADELHTVFQDAWKTDLHAFAWFSQAPENLVYFNDYMALRRKSDLSWLTVYPVAEAAASWDPSQPVYVNVGGGIGHQCAQFKDKFPEIPGRVILQDMPHSISKALPTPGVENMAHNFFEAQPVHGAKFYHMRGVLHNHPPHKVLQILQNLRSAMTHDSVLLLDEMILPEEGVNHEAASMDLTMLGAFAGAERTEAQWRDILKDAGLELVQTYVYNPLFYESVMDVRLPELGS
ncbi:O-methyl transferase B [Thozetella sp. PMI_491]|nr:O-methyl transferase B [Thozetella sp. PMI_491]